MTKRSGGETPNDHIITIIYTPYVKRLTSEIVS